MRGPGRYVAIGDSFTEGVGDTDKRLPNGVRGWADRVAERLARHEPGWEYANLAVRSKRLRHIIADQLPVALALEPTLITVYAGGNDVMDAGTDIGLLLAEYEVLIASLATTGATLVLFTGYDVPVHPLLRPLAKRNRSYNDGVREIARRHGAVLVDYWGYEIYRDRRMWASDRLHMSRRGHRYLAARVLDALEVPHTIKPVTVTTPIARSFIEWEREHRRWIVDWVLPLVHRKLRGVTLGDTLQPRWPSPVRVPPRKGMRAVAKRARSGR